MNIEQTGQIIRRIKTYNPAFTDTDETIIAWYELLTDYTYADCIAAVKDYFATADTPWIMPAHIIHRVQETQNARLQKFGGFMPLNPADEFDEHGNLAHDYHQKIRSLHQLAQHGQITPAQYAAYQAEKLTLTQLHHQAKEITQ